MTKARIVGLLFALAPLAVAAGCDSGASASSVEATCARLGACGLDGDMSIGFGTCYQSLTILQTLPDGPASRWKRDRARFDCFFAADDCEGMLACLRPTAVQAAACEGAIADVCSDNTFISCRDSYDLTAFECGSVGLTCAVGPSGDGTCGLGSCDPAVVGPRCEGDLLVTCESQYHALVSEDCRVSGKTCRSDASGMAACRSDAACDDLTADYRCEGTVAVWCQDGSESRRNCADVGADWTCETKTYTSDDGSVTQSSLGCVPVPKDCAASDLEGCDGSVISYCRAGHPATYDCRSAGFSACVTETPSVTPIARCVGS